MTTSQHYHNGFVNSECFGSPLTERMISDNHYELCAALFRYNVLTKHLSAL